ncbi:MAG: tetratricopeptide repeat protein [bacterium]
MCARLLSRVAFLFVFLSMSLAFASTCAAQSEDVDDADPVRLFERAQAAHAKGDLEHALELYEEAIKVRPEFPEAEFQKGNVLVALTRFDEAEYALRRASKLRKNWSLPYSALGTLLARLNRESEATAALREAVVLDQQDGVALRVLASLRLHAGDAKEALTLAQAATTLPDAPVSAWILRAQAERATGDKAAARLSLDRVLQLDVENVAALIERADLALDQNDYEKAITDLQNADRLRKSDRQILSRLAVALERAGRPDEARHIAETAGLVTTREKAADDKNAIIGTPEEIAAANSDDPAVARKALEKLLDKNPDNAKVLGKLGDSYRTKDAVRSLEFYRRGVEIEPNNQGLATGYAAALVTGRRFADAVMILRRVLAKHPDDYTAHANLATALYSLKRYPEALPEYEWLLRSKPELAVAHYFIATAHDYLGQYQEALVSYESFLGHADAKVNQLEIEKVNLRLPMLRRQIKLGQGVKKKKSE